MSTRSNLRIVATLNGAFCELDLNTDALSLKKVIIDLEKQDAV